MQPKHFAELLQRYRAGACTHEEKELVEDWYHSRLQTTGSTLSNTEEALAGQRIKTNIDKEIEALTRSVPLWRRQQTWWVAAVSLFAITTVTYLALRSKQPVKRPAVTTVAAMPAPGGNKALLTLANGTVIVLDTATNGRLTTQGATTIVKKEDGQLVYDASNATDNSVSWNKISTPRGGQYQIVLPDGSKVWLNAASSLRFPASFSGSERRVELTGEGYFEITHSADKPFNVATSQTTVQVLGTHFNINAYDDEDATRTTLLQGRVAIGNSVLKPGEQASVSHLSHQTQIVPVQTDEVIAWKNGLFQFTNADVQTVMRQIARWYDVEIVYQGKVPTEKFEGEIPRNSQLTEVFKILELSNVHCTIEGKKITVLP